MNRRLPILSGLLLATIAVSQPARGDEIDYVRDVYPIFERHCVGCHNNDDAEGGLNLQDFARLLHGGESGTSVTPGTPDSSRLLKMVRGEMEPKMPPEGEEALSEEEIEQVAAWIEAGAKGPKGAMPIKRTLRTPNIQVTHDQLSPITAMAITADRQRTATASFSSIEIAERDSGETVLDIQDDDLGKINSLVFSADGSQLLVASGLTGAYGRASIYDSQSGELVMELVGHGDILYSAEFSPDEKQVATAGYDRRILLWDLETREATKELKGHNGAIFDLAFSPDGKLLASACADETVKVWNVEAGIRLDTLSQPEGEVFAVTFALDGKFIVAGSADNRIRVWRVESFDKPRINPIVATRFVDETPIVNLATSPDEKHLISVAESGNIKVVRTSDWQPIASLASLGETGTDLYFSPDGNSVSIALMNGKIIERDLSNLSQSVEAQRVDSERTVWLDLGEPKQHTEEDLRSSQSSNLASSKKDSSSAVNDPVDIERNVIITGQILEPGQVDAYRFRAGKGEVWAIDADANEKSRIDTLVRILDAAGDPVLRVQLQAVRDSYFTFRGKNSTQVNDFRVFNWQEMNLSEYLYSAGEVCKLMRHPRGPDSGFDVFPGEGNRWTYFGTSGTTHALGEPAYIVKPLRRGAEPLANGLPVFNVYYENDDDPRQLRGKNSRLLFTAPEDGYYTACVSDTRGEGGTDFGYRLAIRAADPGFVAKVNKLAKPLHPASGREFKISIDRIDGYEGPVNFDINGLPDSLVSNFPVQVEAGQKTAVGLIWAPPGTKAWKGDIEPDLTAWAMINGKRVEREVGSIGKLTFKEEAPAATPSIQPITGDAGEYDRWTLQVRRGETALARVVIRRKEGFKNEVSFGKEQSGRNTSQGVYVDNIGLNGLLIVAGTNEREFFLTADETTKPGKRMFHLTAATDGGIATQPIIVEVLP